MKRADFNPLEMPTNSVSKSERPKPSSTDPQISSTPLSTHKPTIVSKYSKLADELKHFSFSLILNKNFNANDSIEINWSSIRKNLMDLFCNNFNMEVKSIYSFDLDEDELQKNYKIEKGRNRLEEIEGDKNNSKFNIISSGEYVAKMEVLKREMMQKWEVEDKVGTLKIIIHCTKMLNDVFTPKFYTHKFLIISDILDIFAKLVYDRIYKLAFNNDKSIDFSEILNSNINNLARDICLNWILKCSCIRELLPRIYIDINFLKIFRFIYSEKEVEHKILTISKMIRGISHPLINFYVSMYLAKVTLTLYPKFKSFLLVLLDNISKFNLNEDTIKKLGYENITIDELKKVLEPCVEWIVYCLAKNMTGNQFSNLMKVYDDTKNFFILKNLIIHSPAKFVFNQDYLEYIFACGDLYDYNDGVSLYMIICHKIINSNNPIESRQILLMWEKVKKSKSKSIFVDCCTLLGEIIIKFHSEEIQDKFFDEVFDIFKSTIATSVMEDSNYYHKFENFLIGILTKINNYSNILNIDNFLYLLENFNAEVKLNICHTIIGQIISSNEKISDPYLAFSLLKIGKYIHDSLETHSTGKIAASNTKKEISEILTSFIRKVDFGIDYENHLNFLTEARGNYTDLDEVTELLITEVQRICIQTSKIVKGKHNKKTLRFCKVCIAYCQITIPSLRSNFTQIKQLLWTSQIALTNNLISECDSLIKNLLTIIDKLFNEEMAGRKVDKNELELMNNFFRNLISFLIIVPSNPESPYQLISGIINIFSKDSSGISGPHYSFKKKTKLNAYLNLVKYLAAQLQLKLPYHLPNIDSNDEIFTSDESFKNEGGVLLETILSDILNDISEFDSKLTNFDYDDYEYLTLYCLNCAENFSTLFETTKFSKSVCNKMIELAKTYLGNLKKNSSMKHKVDNYTNYINRLNI